MFLVPCVTSTWELVKDSSVFLRWIMSSHSKISIHIVSRQVLIVPMRIWWCTESITLVTWPHNCWRSEHEADLCAWIVIRCVHSVLGWLLPRSLYVISLQTGRRQQCMSQLLYVCNRLIIEVLRVSLFAYALFVYFVDVTRPCQVN